MDDIIYQFDNIDEDYNIYHSIYFDEKIIDENNVNKIFWTNLLSLEEFKIIRKKYPKIQFIFYNFDEPSSFSKDMIEYGKLIDIFINPNKKNKLKYDILLNKNTYVIPKYHFTIEYENIPKYTIIYVNDIIKENTFQYIDEILKYNQKVILYSNSKELKNIYPDIFVNMVDEFHHYEIFKSYKLLFYLDFKMNIRKEYPSFYDKIKRLNCNNIYMNANNNYDMENMNVITIDDIKNISYVKNNNSNNKENRTIKNFVLDIINIIK
tara:strand:- start:450 stop:1244 length:795 start_codon:yes stop_codon:yes gene_type:complete